MFFYAIGRRIAKSEWSRNRYSQNVASLAVYISPGFPLHTNSSLVGEGSPGLGPSKVLSGSKNVLRNCADLVSRRQYLQILVPHENVCHKRCLSSELHWNPGIRRFFCSEAPRKKSYENFYPKIKKDFPKGQEDRKSESKEESNSDEQGNFQETLMKQFQNYFTPILFIGLFLSTFGFGSRDQKQVFPFLILSTATVVYYLVQK